MNLTLHHRNVKMDLVFANIIAHKIYALEETLEVRDAIVTLELDHGRSALLRIRVELETDNSRIVA